MTHVQIRVIINIEGEGQNMKTSEFIRQLKKQGIKFHSHGTRHDWYINPENGRKAQVPRHKTQEIPIGTVNNILKELGLK